MSRARSCAGSSCRGYHSFCLSLPDGVLTSQVTQKHGYIYTSEGKSLIPLPSFFYTTGMSSRLSASLSASSAMSSHTSSQSHVSLPTKRRSPPSKAWVDPMSLPDHGDISCISGNAPDYVKQLNYNTFVSYGVGDEDSFGYQVGNAVKFVDVSIDRPLERNGRMEATTTAELVVTKRKVTFNSTIRGRHLNLDSSVDMLNGAGMLHGAVVTYLIDKCVSCRP